MRHLSRFLRLAVLLGLAIAATITLAKDREFVQPKAYHAKTYPARDAHDDEHVTIAVDPYDMPDKTQIFVVKYREEGFLPVQLIISNDGSRPITLTGMKAELVTSKRVKIAPATPDDIYRRIAQQPVRGDNPTTTNPLPFPRKTVKRSVKKDQQNEIESAQLLAKAVEPHATQAGFLFFDVEGISNPLAGAHLYISGIRDSSGQELLFFDIPLEKYLSYQPGAKP